jgi:hypothetical protein
MKGSVGEGECLAEAYKYEKEVVLEPNLEERHAII